MTPAPEEIIRSYRNLYRHALYAVQYAAPAKYTLRTRLENAYRRGTAADFDAKKIKNTIAFLHGAAREKGLEHKILKSLLHTWYWEAKSIRFKRKDQPIKVTNMKFEQSWSSIQHFEITLKMLNESMGMCLPTKFSTKTQQDPAIGD